MNKVQLLNHPYIDHKNKSMQKLAYPRLQVNGRGEIVLVISKDGRLSRGVLVDKTPESKSALSIGATFSDWEVCGDLIDYVGEVKVSISNEFVSDERDG